MSDRFIFCFEGGVMLCEFENKDESGKLSPAHSIAVHSEAVWGLTGLKVRL